MDGLYLTASQITAGQATLANNKLTEDQIDDMLSLWRGFLNQYAANYPLRTTLESLQDTTTSHKASKIAGCLLLFQDLQFDVSQFVATNANKTGFTDSAQGEKWQIFVYTFGLFWEIPSFLTDSHSYSASSQGLSRKF